MADKKKFPGEVQFENTITTTGTNTYSGVNTFSGGIAVSGGRIRESIEKTDVDDRHHTLTAAQIKKGLVLHTSETGAGNVTTDTAANIIAGIPLDADDQVVKCYYVNDGDRVLTLVGGTGVTVADDGQTIGENESAILLFRRTGAAAVKLYTIGA